jgi:hypothetical protein
MCMHTCVYTYVVVNEHELLNVHMDTRAYMQAACTCQNSLQSSHMTCDYTCSADTEFGISHVCVGLCARAFYAYQSSISFWYACARGSLYLHVCKPLTVAPGGIDVSNNAAQVHWHVNMLLVRHACWYVCRCDSFQSLRNLTIHVSMSVTAFHYLCCWKAW